MVIFTTNHTFLPAVPTGKISTAVKKGGDLSISEQITSVIRQPAFIAGLGVAAWLVLMGFSSWLYCRHHRRKQLGHYTTSFAYTPAGRRGKDFCLIEDFSIMTDFPGKYHIMMRSFWSFTSATFLCSLKNPLSKA